MRRDDIHNNGIMAYEDQHIGWDQNGMPYDMDNPRNFGGPIRAPSERTIDRRSSRKAAEGAGGGGGSDNSSSSESVTRSRSNSRSRRSNRSHRSHRDRRD
jgi:hypothetical protein